ncbi:hypothetical protein K8I61_05340, partial [bacterium]|nr:hypothetical protein [bacterium]
VTAISIDVAGASAGGPAKVTRPSGTARLAIPPLTWPGRRLRVPGAGFADPARAVRGDLVVIVAIPEPEDGDAERRACRDAYVDAMRGPERKVPRALAERIEKLASAKA